MIARPIPVVLYHRILPAGSNPPDKFSTPVDVFAEHLDVLADEGYRTLSLADLEDRLDPSTPKSRSADNERPEVVITFDDGYDCLAEHVAPLLSERDQRAAAFVITDRVGTDGHLDWDQARHLNAEGPIEIRSHSHTHQKWSLGPQTAPEIGDEVATSTALLAEHLDTDPTELRQLAWPYGRTCDAWDEAARRAGATTQFVVQRGAVTRSGQFCRLPRILVDGMETAAFSRWMTALSRPVTAKATNLVFGAIRDQRQGAGYR